MNHVHQHMPHFQSETRSLTEGPVQPLLYKNLEAHPAQKLQERQLQAGERQQLQQMSVLYGSHMAMRHVIDASMCAQVRRLGPHGSSMHLLNMQLGRYYDLDEFDILNNPHESPVLEKEGIHAQLEQVYGL